MTNTESMLEVDHFIMLDVIDTVGSKEFDRSYPYVQIIDPSDMNFYCPHQDAENHPKNGLKQKVREKQLFTITLNVDTD